MASTVAAVIPSISNGESDGDSSAGTGGAGVEVATATDAFVLTEGNPLFDPSWALRWAAPPRDPREERACIAAATG